ncbi:MAG: glycosyltransferase, partial [Candidatus Woesearchaeota archaeon]|nr:glycosyltransferase [Candidatus Woesearchaeota archaeon]
RNYGAKKAKSKIIAFLDADSVPVRSWIESINDAFRDRKLSVISGVDLYENKNPAKRFVLNTFSYIIFYYCTALTWFGKPMLIANNMAIKREVFEKAGGFDHFVVEDYYLTIKLGKFGCITKMDGRMKVECSSRRIDKRGLFNTWKVWFVSLFRKIPSGDYALHDKE